MAKIVRLTEQDLVRLVKKVISEQTKPSSFTNFLNHNRDFRGINVRIIAIEDCLKKNGYSNPEMAPEAFKSIIIATHAFDYTYKFDNKIKQTLKSADAKTQKLLNCIKQNDYNGFFANLSTFDSILSYLNDLL